MPEEMKPDHFPDAGKMILKNCPFCGQRDFCIDEEYEIVVCERCFTTPRDSNGGVDMDTWNSRTPEPGTSVIRWTRYDGTPETLPKWMRSCLFMRPFYIGMAICFLATDRLEWVSQYRYQDVVKIEIGDLWAYLPEPPEGMQ